MVLGEGYAPTRSRWFKGSTTGIELASAGGAPPPPPNPPYNFFSPPPPGRGGGGGGGGGPLADASWMPVVEPSAVGPGPSLPSPPPRA